MVSEIGDHFNNIAVFSLGMESTGSGLVVSGVKCPDQIAGDHDLPAIEAVQNHTGQWARHDDRNGVREH